MSKWCLANLGGDCAFPVLHMEYIDENSVFAKKVETDPGICSSCYRLVREVHEPPEHVPNVQSDILEYEEHVDFAYFDDYDYSGRASVHRAYCPCGPVDWDDVKFRPLSQEEMEKCGQRISERLDEKNVEHNRDVLVDYIEQESRKPENQFREEKVFEEAVDHAINYGHSLSSR